MHRVFASFLFFAFSIQAASEREIAEWVLRWEGTVLLQGASQPVRDLSQLPLGAVHIAAIDLTAGVMHPAELKKLDDLPQLRELYLPGPIWNPGGGKEEKAGVFEALATLTGVQRLAFGWHYNAEMEIQDDDIRHLFPWTELRDLRCSQCRLSKLNLSAFGKLVNLDLSYNPFTDEGMAGLSELKSLRRLLLRDTLVTDEGLKYLSQLTNLEELDLSGTRITDKGLVYLQNLKQMRRLNLLGAQATDASMDILGGMRQLQVLSLYRTGVTNSGIVKLQPLKQLTDVDVRYTRVSSNGIDALHAALPNTRVRFVGSASPKIKSAAAAKPADSTEKAIAVWIEALGGRADFEGDHVVAVNLASTPISDTQISYLSNLQNLAKLELQVTQISDAGLSALGPLGGLRELNLSNTTVSDAGLPKLAVLSHLQKLRLSGTLVQGSGIEALTALGQLRELDVSRFASWR